MEVRTRFAPSPTGYMHLGNLRSALYTYLFAKANGGKFILRIEDTDQSRYVPGAVDVIYRTLKSIGMQWDEGPDIGGDFGPYVQSERKNMYLPYAEQLVKAGKAYYCLPRPTICLNSVIELIRWSRAISFTILQSTPVESSLLVVAMTGVFEETEMK